MSCANCDAIQELMKETGEGATYLRVGNANVLIGACDKHFNELRAMMGMEITGDEVVYRLTGNP